MWMADKPLPQEKLADELGTLVHCFPDPAVAIQFFGMFLRTMSLEWYGIDQWRIDKFMMVCSHHNHGKDCINLMFFFTFQLVRRVTRQMFLVLHQLEWDEQLIELLNGQLEESVLKTATSNGFYMHFTELYPEELAKVKWQSLNFKGTTVVLYCFQVSGGNIPASSVTFLLKPFAIFIAKPRNLRVAWHTVKHIFNNLLFQSELGRAFQDKFEAWKEVSFFVNLECETFYGFDCFVQLGFPGKSIDDLELVDDGESDEETAGIDSHDVKSDEDDEADEDDENDEADEDEESGNADAANEGKY